MLYLRNELLPEISVFFLLVFFLGGGSRNPVVSCNINYNKGLKTQERKTIDDKQESLGLCYFVKHHPHASTTAQVLLKCCSSAAQVLLKYRLNVYWATSILSVGLICCSSGRI